MKQVIERINQAQADVIVAGSGSLPSLIASASNTTSEQEGSLFNADQPMKNVTAGGLGVSWLVDFFGQYRRAKESASASLDAAYASVDIQRLAFRNPASPGFPEPVAEPGSIWRSGSPNRTRTIRQNWVAASLNTGGRPLRPTFGAGHVMSRSSQISREPRRFRASLQLLQSVVRERAGAGPVISDR